jgi:hypothetical protein
LLNWLGIFDYHVALSCGLQFQFFAVPGSDPALIYDIHVGNFAEHVQGLINVQINPVLTFAEIDECMQYGFDDSQQHVATNQKYQSAMHQRM